MKRLIMLMLICGAMLAGRAGLGEEVYADGVRHCYHLSPECALSESPQPAAWSGDEAGANGFYPCAACVPDEAEYPGVEAWERGGTVVIRVPDSTIESRMALGGWDAKVPDALVHYGAGEDADIARLLHGKAYLDYLSGAKTGQVYRASAFIPEYVPDPDGLLMSQRHLGAAWYFVVRPDGDYDGGAFDQAMRFYRTPLEITRWPAGATLEVAGAGPMGEETLAITPKKSGGEVVYREKVEEGDNLAKYVVRDDGVNILIIRERGFDPTFDLIRRTDFCGAQFALYGYADGEDAVFCCVITDGELAALEDGLFFPMDDAVLADVEGEPAAEAALAPGYAPACAAALPDGGAARMDSAEYPVGTPFVSATLSRPAGGIAYTGNEARLEILSDGKWKPLRDFNLAGRIDGDETRQRACWYCDELRLVFPTQPFGALREGLYRLLIDVTSVEGGDDVYTWLEFRVSPGAPQPDLPAPVVHRAPDFPIAAHATPHDDPLAYNSCADTTRLPGSTMLLAGGVVYKLLGVDESWGWGIDSHYSLFAWPEGQPQRAALLAEDIDYNNMTLYDLGDGLLLRDEEDRLFRCDLDGGNLSEYKLFGDESQGFLDMVLVGDGAYLNRGDGVWYAKLDGSLPRRVYAAEATLVNDEAGSGGMVYANGTLLVADAGGIVAIDTTAPRTWWDGLYPSKRLTDRYDPDDGSSGYGYIALNGRLYCWSEEKKATVSMELDGGGLREVSKERFWFHQVTPGGVVLALTGTQEGMFGPERTAAAFYFPKDPERPDFDPDHCEARDIAPDAYDYVLGDWLYSGGTRERIG